MEATIAVTLKRDDGVVVSREVRVSKSLYTKESQVKFRTRARRQALGALNSVLGTPKDLKIEQEGV